MRFPVVIDLLECPEDKTGILNELYSQLLEKLDKEDLLSADRASLLELFNDRFAIAKKQDLAGLDAASETYNDRLNQLVAEWKKRFALCRWETRRPLETASEGRDHRLG